MNFQESNKLNVKKGDFVLVKLPCPVTATIDEIAENFLHCGEVKNVYHNRRGFLRIEVDGLKERAGFSRAFTSQIVSVEKIEKVGKVFGADEQFVEVSTFGINAASQRYNVRNFRGDVGKTGKNEFQVYSYDSGNSYAVKVENLTRHNFNVGCTCADFTNRLRVCKHIVAVFTGVNLVVELKLVA